MKPQIKSKLISNLSIKCVNQFNQKQIHTKLKINKLGKVHAKCVYAYLNDIKIKKIRKHMVLYFGQHV